MSAKYVKLSSYESDIYYLELNVFKEEYNKDSWAFLSNPKRVKERVSAYVRCKDSGDTFINANGLLMKVDGWHAQYLEKVSK
jgi:hypothetical protein